MAKNDNEIKMLAPYIPFQTLTTFVEKLHSTTVPPIIDTSLLPSMSGSMRSQLMSALKFLGLIDPTTGRVTENLRALVKAYKTDTWQEILGQRIIEPYVGIIGDVDLDSGTLNQLYDAFRQRGHVDGEMLDRAVRFYLAGLKESGTTFSPHFTVKKPRGLNAPGRKKGKGKTKNGVEDDPFSDAVDETEISAGYAKFKIPIPLKADAVLWLPRDIDSQDWAMVKVMLDAYVSRLTNE